MTSHFVGEVGVSSVPEKEIDKFEVSVLGCVNQLSASVHRCKSLKARMILL